MLVGAGIYLWLRNRGAQDDLNGSWDETGEDVRSMPALDETADDLMDAIITLDDLYQAGEISEDAYLERRAALKERLQGVLGDDEGS